MLFHWAIQCLATSRVCQLSTIEGRHHTFHSREGCNVSKHFTLPRGHTRWACPSAIMDQDKGVTSPAVHIIRRLMWHHTMIFDTNYKRGWLDGGSWQVSNINFKRDNTGDWTETFHRHGEYSSTELYSVLQLLESTACLLLGDTITHSTPGKDATYQSTLLYQGATLGGLVLLP